MIAILPARGGSKRIPGKNIKHFLGRPALSVTLRKVMSSGLFTRIVVSTDDPQIAQIALGEGAEVLMRPDELSDDYATTVDVISYSITQLNDSINLESDIVACIYPVTPLLNTDYVASAARILEQENLDYVFSAKEFQSSPARSLTLDPDGKSRMAYPENLNTRTQDLPTYYCDAAMFYLGKANSWLEKRPVLNGNSKFVKVGKYETVDVDDPEDWEILEILYKKSNEII